ncbi:L-fucose:H+ symporter permease [Paraclostridium sordellii]|uniref:L-fucose:H+ symporter permease n=1 Tax=Paraclostridium sordellii TaxID=1505 RepID=UPI0005E1EDF7|nr:L-fucose:H+ symporter permease [Paeniclostridium sordellii]CEP48168.1 L-fucose permease [[Clostridium] sordellii] [Paeniclostridium sordellii]
MDGKLSSSVSNKQELTPIVPKKYIAHFIMLISCFVLWGLLNNMTDNLVPAFGRIFMLEAADASLTQVAFYGSYAVLALPAAILIKKYSYRTGVLVGLGLYIVGAMGYIPAAISQNFNLFLASVFVLAGGLSILETTCNPYVISLGSPETSVRRLNLAQAFNPLGSLTGIIMAKYIILSNLNPATYEERVAMSPDALSAIRSNELLWVCVPYVGLVAIALVIWLFFKKSKDSEKDTSGELNIAHSIKKLVRIPRYAFGVVAQFFYVGVQIAVWTWTISYVMTNLGLDEAAASGYYLIAIISFIVCRWICTALMKYIDPAIMMAVFAVGGIVFSLGTIYLPTNQSVWCLVAISACMSLMFPTIYGIALKDLGEEVKVGAAGLIMAILGGAVITPIMGKMIDTGMLSSIVPSFTGAQAAVRSSFLIPAICFLVVLVYSLCFRTKKEA